MTSLPRLSAEPCPPMSDRRRKAVTFTAPRTVEVVDEPLRSPGRGEVLVDTHLSGISPGTERLVYQGRAPSDMEADSSLSALGGRLDFPLQYGYCAVGRVADLGPEVDADWLGQRVFAFQPHVSAFVTGPDALLALPDAVSDRAAVFLPNLETAVNLVMDGRPMIGETVVVFGQGVVGLLTTALLARHPVDVYTVDPNPDRRELSLALGATEAFASSDGDLPDALSSANNRRNDASGRGADLVYELSGRPTVLNDALRSAGFDTRIVVGSWYGTKRAPIQLGDRFHRSRIDLISSQVSTIAPELRGRWTKERRMNTVVQLLPHLPIAQLPTRSFPLSHAGDAYDRLVDQDEPMLQPVFVYPS